ncbi:HNH endonuclease [Amycolatopsis sp. 195334CR]|uniref:HNH endonuclease n=1 Tax=Amycolatopsis sp. 195334CR TaxID=2814588 RepID=UPI001A8DC3EF|nr:HNH endonuclease [Amycolatopsis sp. 195334CR]MBN6040071.1 HNH endonuclease [Amycolatopsis sp. 195334CR]
MIRLYRGGLDDKLHQRLSDATGLIRAKRTHATRVTRARDLWKARRSIRTPLKAALTRFAAGRARCMYCGDNQGADIDHHDPLARSPLRTFTWTNHLLACSVCNSHHKREAFPTADDGTPLLLDPTVDDPLDHLTLALSIGLYHPTTERGRVTIEICALNRDLLTRGRQAAYESMSALLHRWRDLYDEGDSTARTALERVIVEQPFADVVHAMIRYSDAPGATEVFADRPHVLQVLTTPEFRAIIS